ncbi:hypothetical protein HPP92_029060, partial [Vanilla planifolia]
MKVKERVGYEERDDCSNKAAESNPQPELSIAPAGLTGSLMSTTANIRSQKQFATDDDNLAPPIPEDKFEARLISLKKIFSSSISSIKTSFSITHTVCHVG